jgi:Tn3 transposase DDE domain
MLRDAPHGAPRMTRGQSGLLLLYCDGLSPFTLCRSPGALASGFYWSRAGKTLSCVVIAMSVSTRASNKTPSAGPYSLTASVKSATALMRTQSHRASRLNLLVAAIILWNTVYLQRAVDHYTAKAMNQRQRSSASVATRLGAHQPHGRLSLGNSAVFRSRSI